MMIVELSVFTEHWEYTTWLFRFRWTSVWPLSPVKRQVSFVRSSCLMFSVGMVPLDRKHTYKDTYTHTHIHYKWTPAFKHTRTFHDFSLHNNSIRERPSPTHPSFVPFGGHLVYVKHVNIWKWIDNWLLYAYQTSLTLAVVSVTVTRSPGIRVNTLTCEDSH